MASAIDVTKPISGTSPGPTTASVRSNFSIAASEISALQAPADGRSYAQQDGGVVNFPTFLGVVLKHNAQPAPLPPPAHVPTDMRIAPVDGVPAAILLDSWGTTATNTSILSLRHAGGTAAVPGQSILDAGLGRIEMIGHDTSAYGGAGATMTAFAAEGWTPVSHGTYVNFATMAKGQTGGVVRMQIGALGGLVVGAPASVVGGTAGGINGDMGPGTLNAANGIYVNGAPVGGGPGGGMSGPIVFNAPLTGGTITSSGTVGLATPSAQLLGGTGTGFAAVSVGSGLNLSGLGVLTATGSGSGNVNAGAALTANQLVLGAGGQAIATLTGTPGTTGQVLTAQTGAAPIWAAPSGSGTPGGSAGNVQYNSAGTSFGGSTGATFTAASLTALNIALGSDAVGDMYYRGTGGALTRIAPGTSGFLLQSGGVGAAPSWISTAVGGGTVSNSPAGSVLAWYSAPGQTVSGLATISAQAAGSLSINQSPNPAPAFFLPGTLLQLVGNDGAGQPNIEMTGFAGSPGLVGRRAGGTSGALANTTSGASLLAFTARGWDSTNLWMPGSSTGANLIFQVAESPGGWTSTAHGTNIQFSTTPIGQLTLGPQVVIGPSAGVAGSTGGVTVGNPTPTGTPLLTGDLNCMRLFINGAAPTGAAAADTISAAVHATAGSQGTVPLISQFNVVTICDPGGVVTLRAIPAGDHCIVRNSGANPLTIYPATGVQINAGGVNTAHVNPILPNSTIYFEGLSSTQCFSIP